MVMTTTEVTLGWCYTFRPRDTWIWCQTVQYGGHQYNHYHCFTEPVAHHSTAAPQHPGKKTQNNTHKKSNKANKIGQTAVHDQLYERATVSAPHGTSPGSPHLPRWMLPSNHQRALSIVRPTLFYLTWTVCTVVMPAHRKIVDRAEVTRWS